MMKIMKLWRQKEPKLRVEIDQRRNEPTTCKVWRDGVLVFNGRDYSADLKRVR